MTNKDKAALVQAIINKMKVDTEIESAPIELLQKPKSFSQKAREVNDYIKTLNQPSEIELFISSASRKEKERAVDAIFKDFKNQNNTENKDKQKKAVDKAAEKLRNTSGTMPVKQSEKAAYFDKLQNYYKQEKKQDAVKKTIDNYTEIKRSNNSSSNAKENAKTNNVFANIQLNQTKNNQKIDYIWYTKQIRQYNNTDIRKQIEIESRTNRYLNASPGQMFSFKYFAKTESMRVFDRSPMVYVLENNGDTFRGINFHWIRNKNLRFELVEQLIQGETPIFPLLSFHTYSVESKCLLSPLYHINMTEWKTAVLLPLEQFYYR